MALQRNASFERDVVVIGGCGHVGLPLAIAFADRGANVAVYDVNPDAVAQVGDGRMPFDEPGAAPCSSARSPRGAWSPRPTRRSSARPRTSWW